MAPPPEPHASLRTIADVLRLRRPTTGTYSLLPSCPSPSTSAPTSPRRKKPKLSAPIPAPFAPIPHPILLSGTLFFPSETSPEACRNHCLSLSDASSAASVCCYLLDFDPTAVGRTIYILAWNYLPSVRHKEAGVLEVVRWSLTEPPAPCPAPNPGFLTTIPLSCACADAEPDLVTRGRVFGVLRSVSMVFSVPRAAQKSKADGADVLTGFIAEMMCCGCRRCKLLPPETERDHKFEVEKFVYFVDLLSRWRPLLAQLVGRPVSVSGLKKKLVSVGNKGSYTMLMSSTKTMLACCPSYVGVLPLAEVPEKCCGAYRGVVTGIYMQGRVVELDEIVCLLIDDQQLPPPHSLRVGSVISVRNFRAIRPKFSWKRIVLLGICSRTSIAVNSFSFVNSECHRGAESKYVDSLELSARFWVLLLISCFKQKFTKLLSVEDIMGSKDKHGLVHTYANKVISSKGSEPQRDFFMKFCNHNCGGPSTKPNSESCKLVIPFANFICKIESMWVSIMLKSRNGAKEVDMNPRLDQFLCDRVSNPGSTKLIISSDDLGFVLVGRIKTSSLPGRLQLVDSTGCIDVVVPDLPPNVCTDGIYEINNYELALEGPVAYLDHYGAVDPLSCKALFQKFSDRKRVRHLNIHVIVYWGELDHIDSTGHVPLHDASLSAVSPCLVIHQKHFADNRRMLFHCRVVTIHYLMLDSCVNGFQASESINQSKTLKIKVPLAGFVVDDGSYLCCCWADNARAELLLRLHEVSVLDASVNTKFSKDISKANLQQTVGSCLETMLKKHKKIIVKNYGVSPDVSCRNLELSSVLGKVLSSVEQKLLKFVILNACQEGALNVIASVPSPSIANELSSEVPDVYPVQNMQNFWVNEAFQVDPLEEARRLHAKLRTN